MLAWEAWESLGENGNYVTYYNMITPHATVSRHVTSFSLIGSLVFTLFFQSII